MKVFSKALPTVDLTEFLNFSSIVGQVGREINPTITQNPEVEAKKSTNFKNRVTFDMMKVEEDMIEVRRKPTHMEGLDVRGGNGQDYGFIVYR